MSTPEKYDETPEYWIGWIRGIVETGGTTDAGKVAEVKDAIRRYEEKRKAYYARIRGEGGGE